MLTACAASADRPAPPVADPVIEHRVELRTACPPEVLLPVPPRPVPAAAARIDGNEDGMAWLAAIIATLGLLEDRLADAAKDCP